jgi:NAD(P)-dependent dehydrogenase (short-subunit alcohol dehydrogenase family)
MNNFPENITAVVAGSGNICIDIITALLRHDATVVVPVKSYEEIRSLQDITADISTGDLVPVLADIPDHHRATYLFEDIELRFGQINLTIIVFDNDYADTPLTQTPYEEWERMQRDSISACFMVGKVILEFMKRNLQGIYRNAHGIYVAVSDTASRGRSKLSPLSAIAIYIQGELSKIFAEEVQDTGIKFHHIIATEFNRQTGGPDIARYILNLCTV